MADEITEDEVSDMIGFYRPLAEFSVALAKLLTVGEFTVTMDVRDPNYDAVIFFWHPVPDVTVPIAFTTDDARKFRNLDELAKVRAEDARRNYQQLLDEVEGRSDG